MHRMLAVVFEDENKANEGKEALLQLEREGSISIYHYLLVSKAADGATILKSVDEHCPFNAFASASRTASQTSANATAVAQAAGDMQASVMREPRSALMDEAFVEDVTKVLLPNREALVAEIEEEFPIPLDSRMEALGGIVFRWDARE